jgi:hypothetical protein
MGTVQHLRSRTSQPMAIFSAPAQARESLGAEPPLQSPAPDLAGTAPRSNWPRPGAAYLLPDRAHAPATWTRSDCTQPACGPDPTNDSTISPKPHVELGMAVSKRLICPNNNLIASIWRFNISFFMPEIAFSG